MGDNIHLPANEGLRTPMQWSPSQNGGFSNAEPSHLYRPVNSDPRYGYQVTSVESQLRSPGSLLNWLRRLLHIRSQYPALRLGKLELLTSEKSSLLAWVCRLTHHQPILCVANLSGRLAVGNRGFYEFKGQVPVDLLSDTRLPTITGEEIFYNLPLPGNDFRWFRLEGAPKLASCLLSYSSKDDLFADQLHEDLTLREVRCWKASRHLSAGERFRERIAAEIRRCDRVIVICSGNALESQEVALEVQLAMEEERRRAVAGGSAAAELGIILPIRLDDAIQQTSCEWATAILLSRHIEDFRGWRDLKDYQQALNRLLKALAVSQGGCAAADDGDDTLNRFGITDAPR
jgi:hypothetical protein